MTTATPDYDALERAGWPDDGQLVCANCGVDVVKNYDGRGTGWFHCPKPEDERPGVYPGARHCATT
jgi:hypothetical protein